MMCLSDEERASNYYVKTGALRNSSGTLSVATVCVPTGTRHENKHTPPAIIHTFSIFILPIQIIFVILQSQTSRGPQG